MNNDNQALNKLILIADEVRRIHFATDHKEALKKDLFKFKLPFSETIKKLFEKETGLIIEINEYGPWIHWSQAENSNYLPQIENFIEKYRNNVFIRDFLDLSIAMDMRSSSNDPIQEPTELGNLFNKAKYGNCENSIQQLVEKMKDFVANTPYYRDCRYICSVPSSKVGVEALPAKITNSLSNKLPLKNLSSSIKWLNKERPIKEMESDNNCKKVKIQERWLTPENSGFEINMGDLDSTDKSVILIDDLYETGVTVNYIADELKKAGFSEVYGLYCTKSLSK
jgi:hypothetical protein